MATTLGNVNLFVRDLEQAKRFYTEGIGLVEDTERSHPPSFVLLQAGESTLTLQDASSPGAAFEPVASIELGFRVDNVDEVRTRLQAWNTVVSDVQHMGWGSGFDAVDPDGHRLTVYRMRE
jgi:catechol 2,3-dioxygenase-like lactoylglutathione lyase family enzyme